MKRVARVFLSVIISCSPLSIKANAIPDYCSTALIEELEGALKECKVLNDEATAIMNTQQEYLQSGEDLIQKMLHENLVLLEELNKPPSWYENPYLLIGLGFVAGVMVNR